MLLRLLTWDSKPRTEFKNKFKWIQNLQQQNGKLKIKDIEKRIIKTHKNENLILP